MKYSGERFGQITETESPERMSRTKDEESWNCPRFLPKHLKSARFIDTQQSEIDLHQCACLSTT